MELLMIAMVLSGLAAGAVVEEKNVMAFFLNLAAFLILMIHILSGGLS